jgi:hypothetical protein
MIFWRAGIWRGRFLDGDWLSRTTVLPDRDRHFPKVRSARHVGKGLLRLIEGKGLVDHCGECRALATSCIARRWDPGNATALIGAFQQRRFQRAIKRRDVQTQDRPNQLRRPHRGRGLVRNRGRLPPAAKLPAQILRHTESARRNRRRLGPVPLSGRPLRFRHAHAWLSLKAMARREGYR